MEAGNRTTEQANRGGRRPTHTHTTPRPLATHRVADPCVHIQKAAGLTHTPLARVADPPEIGPLVLNKTGRWPNHGSLTHQKLDRWSRIVNWPLAKPRVADPRIHIQKAAGLTQHWHNGSLTHQKSDHWSRTVNWPLAKHRVACCRSLIARTIKHAWSRFLIVHASIFIC